MIRRERHKPWLVVRARTIKQGGKHGTERRWGGRCFLNELQANGAAHVRWLTCQNSNKHHYDNNTEIYITDCENEISLDFHHATLKEYKYSIRKIDRLINQLCRARRAMYSAAKARGLKVDG